MQLSPFWAKHTNNSVFNKRLSRWYQSHQCYIVTHRNQWSIQSNYDTHRIYVKILILPIMQSNICIVSCLFFSIGPLIILMCSIKLLRFAFSQTSKQYLIMTFTVFFFKYDYRHATETFLIDYFFISIIFVKVSLCFPRSLMFNQIDVWWSSVQII